MTCHVIITLFGDTRLQGVITSHMTLAKFVVTRNMSWNAILALFHENRLRWQIWVGLDTRCCV